MLQKMNLKTKKSLLLIGSAVLLTIVSGVLLAVRASANKAEPKEAVTYYYTEAEQKLAGEVKAYLAQYMELLEFP